MPDDTDRVDSDTIQIEYAAYVKRCTDTRMQPLAFNTWKEMSIKEMQGWWEANGKTQTPAGNA